MRTLTKKPIEADLMIANPDRYAGKYAEAGADFVIVHVEASQNPRQTFKEIRGAGPVSASGLARPPRQPSTTWATSIWCW
jgi:ribulose-phosphate 3-epimerase